MPTSAKTCSRSGCRNRTLQPSGLCWRHEAAPRPSAGTQRVRLPGPVQAVRPKEPKRRSEAVLARVIVQAQKDIDHYSAQEHRHSVLTPPSVRAAVREHVRSAESDRDAALAEMTAQSADDATAQLAAELGVRNQYHEKVLRHEAMLMEFVPRSARKFVGHTVLPYAHRVSRERHERALRELVVTQGDDGGYVVRFADDADDAPSQLSFSVRGDDDIEVTELYVERDLWGLGVATRMLGAVQSGFGRAVNVYLLPHPALRGFNASASSRSRSYKSQPRRR